MTAVPGVKPLEAAAPAAAIRHGLLVRLTHFLNVVFLAGMIGSGLQIYAAYQHFGIRGETFALLNPFDGSRLPIPGAFRLGGWLAGGLRWHFVLAWPFALTGLAYVMFLVWSGEWRAILFRPRDVPAAWQMTRYYLRLRREPPPQGKHNALQKSAYTFVVVLAVLSILTGFAVAKPVQLSWLTGIFGGYQLARYWHFVAVWTFLAFLVVHVVAVFVSDPASLRAIITGRYRVRHTAHD